MLQKSPALPAMMFTFLLDFIGLTMVIPIFAPLLLDPNSLLISPTVSTGIRISLTGLLIASYGFGQFWGGPILGELSDQFGRKKVLIYGLICLVLANFLGALALIIDSLALLFICRFLTGFASGNASILFAAAANMSVDARERGVALGYLAGACSVGAILGPLLGSSLSSIAWFPWPNAANPFLFMSLGFLLNILMLVLLYKDHAQYTRRTFNLLTGFKNIKDCFLMPSLPLLLLAYFFFVLSTETLFAGLPIFAVEKFEVSSTWLGWLFAAGGFCSAISSLYINRKISHILNSNQIILLALTILCITYSLFLIPTHPMAMFIPYSLVGFTCVMVWAHSNSVISGTVGENVQGKVLGVAQSLLSLSTLIGPTLMGLTSAYNYNMVLIISSFGGWTALLCFWVWVKKYSK